jgi:hypothetical protein
MRDKEVVIRHIALLSLANLSYSGTFSHLLSPTIIDYNRSLMVEEEIIDDIACMEWSNDGVLEDQKKNLLNIIWQNFGYRPVPSLYHICIHHIHLSYPHLIPYAASLRA